MTKRTLDIGLRQARRLCQMSHDKRLTFLAEGLPIILASAQGFWKASRHLMDMPREAEVLEGFAKEEAAKILILMDAVRCPVKLLPSKLGTIIGWFYNHLARLIYADAVTWKPMHLAQLRQYVEPRRKAHNLEGGAGEYILPNWTLYQRESGLYADIEAHEDDQLGWNTPTGQVSALSWSFPRALRVVEAMSALGIFTTKGLKATSEIWGQVEFTRTEDHTDAARLTEALLEWLIGKSCRRKRQRRST